MKQDNLDPKKEEDIMHISSITNETRKWTAKVRVLSKLGVRTSTSSPLKYQKVILGDEMGGSVEAIIYKNDIDMFKDKLEDSKTYMISNAKVTKANELYKNELISSSYQWTISSNTSVMPVYDGVICSNPLRPVFFQYDKFPEFLDTKRPICTICVVIEKRSPKIVFVRGQQETLHEYAFVDKQMSPFVVSFWSSVVSEATYAALDACHKRLSLCSTSSSIVLTEMDTDAFTDMRTWCIEQSLFIDDIVEKGGLFEEKIGHVIVKKTPLDTISGILGSDLGIFHVKVKAFLDNETQSFIYMCCEECRNGIDVGLDASFSCDKCKTNKIAKPRYRFRLTIFDGTGSLEITIFGKDGEAFFGMTAQEFHDLTLQDEVPSIHSINSKLKDLYIIMRIRSTDFTGPHGKKIIVYTMLSMDFLDKLHRPNPVPSPTATKHLSPSTNSENIKGKRKLSFDPSITSSNDEHAASGLEIPMQTSRNDDVLIKKRMTIKEGKSKIAESFLLDKRDDSFVAPGSHNISCADDMPLSASKPKKGYNKQRSTHPVVVHDDVTADILEPVLRTKQGPDYPANAGDDIKDIRKSTRGRLIRRKRYD